MLKNIVGVLCVLLVVISSVNIASAKDMSKEINAATEKIMPKLVKWRRHIHENPELSNREFKTAKYVEEHIRSLGFEVKTGIAKTGVIGILKGNRRDRRSGFVRIWMVCLSKKELIFLLLQKLWRIIRRANSRDARLRTRYTRGDVDGNGGSSGGNEG